MPLYSKITVCTLLKTNTDTSKCFIFVTDFNSSLIGSKFPLSNECMCVSQFDYLAVGISLLKCQCSFVGIWSISINSSHVTGPHLKATLSLWKHQTNLRSCQTPQIIKTQKTNSESSKNYFPTHMKIHF